MRKLSGRPFFKRALAIEYAGSRCHYSRNPNQSGLQVRTTTVATKLVPEISRIRKPAEFHSGSDRANFENRIFSDT